MSDVKPDGAAARRRIQAAVWFTRVRADGLTARAQRSWEAWRALPENQQAFDSVRAVWQAVRDASRRELPATAMHHGASPGDSPATRPDVHDKQSSMAFPAKVAACIAVMAIAAFGFALVRMNAAVAVVQTTVAEWRTVSLEDGSVVKLGPRTSLELELSERQRLLRLVRGEAYFRVAKDPSRPFIVAVDASTVRATGTEFAVSRADGDVTVTVAEGVVMVYPSESNAREIELSAGKQMMVRGDVPTVPRDIDLRSTLAWTQRRLVLNGETLEQAVEAFNRRNAVQLKIADRMLAAEKITRGTFQLDDPESFAESLARSGQAVIVRERPGVLRLEPGPSL